MAAETSINIGGTWKSIDDCHVNIGGVWKQVDTIYINIGGTWKTAWENISISLSTDADTATDGVSPYDSTVIFKIDNDGWVYSDDSINGGAISYTQSQQWGSGGGFNAADYDVRVTSVNHNAGIDPGSGWASSPGADGTWFNCGTDQIWSINETAVGDYTTTATVEIRPTGGGATLASATFSWNINNIV